MNIRKFFFWRNWWWRDVKDATHMAIVCRDCFSNVPYSPEIGWFRLTSYRRGLPKPFAKIDDLAIVFNFESTCPAILDLPIFFRSEVNKWGEFLRLCCSSEFDEMLLREEFSYDILANIVKNQSDFNPEDHGHQNHLLAQVNSQMRHTDLPGDLPIPTDGLAFSRLVRNRLILENFFGDVVSSRGEGDQVACGGELYLAYNRHGTRSL